MAWNQIDPTTPDGGSKKKFGDDAIRELKGQVINNLQEISHYPVSSTLRKAVWTTATRPTSGLVDRLSGYNDTIGMDEYYDLAEEEWLPCVKSTILQAMIDAVVPAGVITLWSGAANAIPTGWKLCNGKNGTPNLTDKFVIGAGNTYAVAATGGAATVTLTTEQIPSHNHTLTGVNGSLSDNGNVGSSFVMDNNEGVYGWQSGPYAAISSVGGGQSHDNIPPYYALCYIMRTG